MWKFRVKSLALCIMLCVAPVDSSTQRKNKVLTCKRRALATLKPLPQLTYQCPEDVANEFDDRILKSPERSKARGSVVRELRSFADPGWWETAVEDLNLCELRGRPGALSAREGENFSDPERQQRLLGDNRIRVVVAPDSCYQTHYNGANVFLLHRNRGKVYVTEALDGYYSRVADSISLRVRRLNGEQVIEIITTNISGMRPDSSKYYFVIDKATNKAIPKRLSRRGRKWFLEKLSGGQAR